MLRYNINKISEVNLELLSNFYKDIFFQRHRSLIKNLKWWYRLGYNEFEPLVLSVDGKVIGQAGLLPVDLIIKKKEIKAIWFIDFAILSRFRGKGYGQILTKEWMKICPNQITYCNKQSLRIFKKLGWRNNLSTRRLLRPINYLKFIPVIKKFEFKFANNLLRETIKKKFSSNTEVKVYKLIENYKIIKDSFFLRKKYQNDKHAEIIRDDKWLDWKLIECPYKDQLYFFEYKNNFSIVRIDLIKNIKRVNILYNYCTESTQEDELYYLIINWAIKNDIDLLWAVNRENKFKNFFPHLLSKPINFASWSQDNEILQILQNGLLDSQAIDSDIDSNLYNELV